MIKTNKQFYFGVLPAMIVPTIASLFYFKIFSKSIYGIISYAFLKVFLIVWPFIWISPKGIKKIFTGKKDIKSSIIFGSISGIIILILMMIGFFIFKDMVYKFSETIFNKLDNFYLDDIRVFIGFSIFLCFFHSLLEEYYWRLFVFEGLTFKFNPVLAVVLASLSFASHHYIIMSEYFTLLLTVISGTIVGLASALWCYILYKTKSIIGSWICHIAADLAVVIVGYLIIFK